MNVYVSTALPIDQQMNVCEQVTPNRATDECTGVHGTPNRAADLIDRLFAYSGIHNQYALHVAE